MFEQAFHSFFWENVSKHLVIEQESKGVIKHLTHLEELILTRQKEGVDIALSFITGLLDTFNGNSKNEIFTTIKYDGAPAIICGYDPQNGKFFVSTKSLTSKIQKINYNVQDIQKNYGQAPGLAQKMKLALLYLPKVIKPGNIYQCDFMFDRATLQSVTHNGENLITFKPNTITYAVEANSELGQRIQKAQIGVIFHTRYDGNNLQEFNNFISYHNIKISEFNKTPEVWFDDASFKDVTGTASLKENEKALILQNIENIKTSSTATEWFVLPKEFYSLANTFINVLVRRGTFVDDLDKTYDEFINWYSGIMDTAINKLLTDKGKQKKIEGKKKTIDFFNKHKMSIINIFNITKKIVEIKKIFMEKYNDAIKTKQFIAQPDGTLKVTPGEGFVSIDSSGNKIKLVDRLEFSRANFAIPRDLKFKPQQ